MASILSIPFDLTTSMLSGTTPTGGSLANLISNRVGLVCRWPGTAGGSPRVDVDLGVSKTVDVVAGLWTNLRSTDKVRIQAGTGPGLADLYDSGEINAWYSTKKVTGAAKSLKILPTPVSARYWRFAILPKTTDHPDGFVELSRIFLGERINFGLDYTTLDLLDDDRGIVDRSDYGEDMEDARRVSFGWRPRYRFGSQAEMLTAHRLLTMRGTTKPVLFGPMDAATTDDAMDLLAFGKLRSAAKTSSVVYDIWEMSFEIYSEAA